MIFWFKSVVMRNKKVSVLVFIFILLIALLVLHVYSVNKQEKKSQFKYFSNYGKY